MSAKYAKYVRCIDNRPDGWVTLKFPEGTVVQALHLGARYLASEAVVKQHPERFEPVERLAPATEKAA